MKNSCNAILKKLDNPVRILSFSIGDLMAYLAPFFIGSLLDSMFFIPVIGIILMFLSKKVLRRFSKFYVMRVLYWSLPTKQFNKILKVKLPPSHKRFWIQ